MASALSRKELIRKFRALGFSGPFSGAKHQFMIKGTQKIRIPNPHVTDIRCKSGQKRYFLKRASPPRTGTKQA